MDAHRRFAYGLVCGVLSEVRGFVYCLLASSSGSKLRAMGLENVNSEIELGIMKRILRKSHISIMLTGTSLFEDEDALPLWIVLTGYAKEDYYVNNPLADRANTRID